MRQCVVKPIEGDSQIGSGIEFRQILFPEQDSIVAVIYSTSNEWVFKLILQLSACSANRRVHEKFQNKKSQVTFLG